MRRSEAALAAVLLAAGCGRGGSSPVAATPSPPGGGDPSLVVLDSGNFDALVLAAPRPSLVKFQSPT